MTDIDAKVREIAREEAQSTFTACYASPKNDRLEWDGVDTLTMKGPYGCVHSVKLKKGEPSIITAESKPAQSEAGYVYFYGADGAAYRMRDGVGRIEKILNANPPDARPTAIDAEAAGAVLFEQDVDAIVRAVQFEWRYGPKRTDGEHDAGVRATIAAHTKHAKPAPVVVTEDVKIALATCGGMAYSTSDSDCRFVANSLTARLAERAKDGK